MPCILGLIGMAFLVGSLFESNYRLSLIYMAYVFKTLECLCMHNGYYESLRRNENNEECV